MLSVVPLVSIFSIVHGSTKCSPVHRWSFKRDTARATPTPGLSSTGGPAHPRISLDGNSSRTPSAWATVPVLADMPGSACMEAEGFGASAQLARPIIDNDSVQSHVAPLHSGREYSTSCSNSGGENVPVARCRSGIASRDLINTPKPRSQRFKRCVGTRKVREERRTECAIRHLPGETKCTIPLQESK